MPEHENRRNPFLLGYMRMRYGILASLCLTTLLVGATCFPIFEPDAGQNTATPSTTLGVSMLRPSADREVALGDEVEVEWTGVNLNEGAAVATVYVRNQTTYDETILQGGIRMGESSGEQVIAWDTSVFEGGEYSIHVSIESGTQEDTAEAAGRITINSPPAFEFTEPTEDTELVERDPNDPNDPNAPMLPAEITIRWTAYDSDSDGEATISIDPDTDHDSGNEIEIHNVDIPRASGFETYDWDGKDKSGDRVEGDTYYLFATVSDPVNGEEIVEGLARLIVPVDEEFELAVTQPEDNTDFLTADDPLEIEFTFDEEDDVLIDLRIDHDENHSNGNEITILSQRLIDKDTHEDSFDWNGDDSDGNAVDDGIYRIFMSVNRGSGSPVKVEAEGLVYRRGDADQPLIGLILPTNDETLTGGAGGDVLIKWCDDDPSESATIKVVIDDDATPNEGVETDDAEVVILAGRDADGDGVQDTFSYSISDDLAPGRYWIFAYIDRDDAAPWDNISVAAGQIVVEDPDEAP